jgi:hypothetical protein
MMPSNANDMRKSNILEKNLSQLHWDHLKSHTDWSEIKSGPLEREVSKQLPELWHGLQLSSRQNQIHSSDIADQSHLQDEWWHSWYFAGKPKWHFINILTQFHIYIHAKRIYTSLTPTTQFSVSLPIIRKQSIWLTAISILAHTPPAHRHKLNLRRCSFYATSSNNITVFPYALSAWWTKTKYKRTVSFGDQTSQLNENNNNMILVYKWLYYQTDWGRPFHQFYTIKHRDGCIQILNS